MSPRGRRGQVAEANLFDDNDAVRVEEEAEERAARARLGSGDDAFEGEGDDDCDEDLLALVGRFESRRARWGWD